MARHKHVNLTGRTYGRYEVISEEIKEKNKPYFYLCKCSCGEYRIVRLDNLTSGSAKSCGCIRKEQLGKLSGRAAVTHGMSKSYTYRRWTVMKAGCYNPRHMNYKCYGAKGIQVCPRWLVFRNFLADVGVMEKGDRLTRENKRGDWEPDNVNMERGKSQDS